MLCRVRDRLRATRPNATLSSKHRRLLYVFPDSALAPKTPLHVCSIAVRSGPLGVGPPGARRHGPRTHPQHRPESVRHPIASAPARDPARLALPTSTGPSQIPRQPLLDRRRAPRKTITSLRASKPGANYSRNKHKHRLACTHRHTCGHFHSSQRGETSSHALVLRVAFAVRRDESRPGDWDVEDTRMGERASRQAHTRVRDTLCAACACQTH